MKRQWTSCLLIASLLAGLIVPSGGAGAVADPVPTGEDGGYGTLWQADPASHTQLVAELASPEGGGAPVGSAVYGAKPRLAGTIAAPVLDPLPEVTNASDIRVAGIAPLNAEVTIGYGFAGGGFPYQEGPVVASDVYGPGLGRFEITLHLSEPGVYELIAFARLNGEQSEDTAPVRVEIDRTAPEGWTNLQWNNVGYNEIELRWEPIMVPDPENPPEYMPDPTIDRYRLERQDGDSWTVLKETKDDFYYFDAGLPEEQYVNYRLSAFDKAGNQSEYDRVYASTFHRYATKIAEVEGWDGGFWDAKPSRDGSTVVFVSDVKDLPGGGGSGFQEFGVYVYDVKTKAIERIGTTTTIHRAGDAVSVSGDGRYVAFETADGIEENYYVTVYDRVTKTSDNVVASHASFGYITISDDGNRIAFSSSSDDLVENDTNEYGDVFLVDRTDRANVKLKRISVRVENGQEVQANDDSMEPVISGDGRYVAFVSAAPELIPGGTANDSTSRLFLYDTTAGGLEHIPLTVDGEEVGVSSPSLSADGRYIAYRIYVNFRGVRTSVYDRSAGSQQEVWFVPGSSNLSLGNPQITDDGKYVGLDYTNYNPGPDTKPFLSQFGAIRFEVANKDHYRYIGRLSGDTDAVRLSGDGKKAVFISGGGGEAGGRELIWVCLDDCSDTPPPQDPIAKADVRMTQQVHGQPTIGGKLDIRAIGKAGQLLKAVVEYRIASETANRTAVVELVGNDRAYAGTFEIPAHTERIEKIRVEHQSDPSVYKEVSGFPVEVAGRIKMTIASAYPEQLKGAKLAVWSESKRQGNSVKFADSLEATVALGAADDYTLQIVDAGGSLLYERTGIIVEPGRELALGADVMPVADLAVRVHGEQNETLYGATVTFRDGEGRFLHSGKPTYEGTVRLKGKVFAGQVVQIEVAAHEPYELSKTASVTLTPGANRTDIGLLKLTMGVITGTASFNGQGVPGTVVKLLGWGRSVAVAQGVTDAQGTFSIRVDPGAYYLTAESSGTPDYRSDTYEYVTVGKGQTVTKSIPLTNRGPGMLALRAWVKPVNGDYAPISIADWRSAVHYGLSVKAVKAAVGWSQSSLTENGIQINASPGDELEVCMSGREAGLTGACERVVLDERRNGSAELKLEEKARIVGAIADVDNAFNYSVTLYHNVGGQLAFRKTYSVDADGRFSLSVAEPGKYAVVLNRLSWSSNWWRETNAYRVDVEVAEGQLLEIPDIRIPTDSPLFTGKPGNGIGVTDMTAAAGDTVTMRGSYEVPYGNHSLQDAYLAIGVPAGSELVPNSVTLNGTPVVPERANDGMYKVPLGSLSSGKKGALGYKLAIGENASSVLEARLFIGYRKQGEESKEESLGSAYIRVSQVTLEAPARAKLPDIALSGRAPAGQTVLVEADDRLIATAQATAGGLWFAKAKLPESPRTGIWGDETVYRLVAKTTTAGGVVQSEPAKVLLDQTRPVVTEVVMRQTDGREMKINPSEGVSRFPYVVVPGMAMMFAVKVSNPEAVRAVRVQMGDKVAQAWLESEGVYRASINVDNQMGTGVYVTIDEKPRDVYGPTTPPTEEQWKRALASTPDYWSGAVYEKVEGEPEGFASAAADEDGYVHAPTVKVTHPGEKEPSFFRFSVKAVDASAEKSSVSYDAATGIMEITATVSTAGLGESGKAMLAAAFGSESLAKGIGDHIAVKMTTKVAGAAFAYAKSGYDFANYADALLDFQDYVINSECHTPTVNHYIRETERLYEKASRDLVAKHMLTGVAGVIGALTMVVPPVGGLVAGGIAGKVGGLITKNWNEDLEQLKQEFEKDKKWRDDMAAAGAIDRCKKKDDDDDDDEKRKKKPKDDDKVADPTWIWDPSGYVYEAVPDNRVEGVTATVLQQDPDRPDVWGEWDSAWFGQQNPLVTDKEGRYGWDVPEGKWRVVFEKEGYLPAQSEDLTVLPPHFDVNVPIVSLEPPTYTVSDAVYGSSVLLTFSKYMVADTVTEDAVFVETTDGEPVAGKVEAVDPQPDASNTMLSRQFRFIPDEPLAEGDNLYKIRVLAHAQSYAHVAMAEEKTYALTVKPSTAAPAEAVSGFTATGGSKMLTLEWDENDAVDFDKLKLYWVPKGSSCTPKSVDVPKGQGHTVLEPLCPGTTYSLRLVTVGPNGVESAGIETEGTTAPEAALVQDTKPPGVVAGVAVTAEAEALTVGWKDPSDADLRKVLVSWRKKGEAKYGKPLYADKGEQSLRIEGLQPGTEYEIRLAAADTYWNVSPDVDVSAVTKTKSTGGDGGSGDGGTPPPAGPVGGPAPGKPPAGQGAAVVELTGKEQRWAGFDDRIAIVVPEGAFEAGERLTVQPDAKAQERLPDGYARYGDAFAVTVPAGGPKKPMTLVLKYDAQKHRDFDARKLGVYRLDDGGAGAWQYVGGLLHSADGTISASVERPGTYAVLDYTLAFADLSQHWSKRDVEVLVSRHIVDGLSASEFGPDRPITRAQFTKLLVEMKNGKETVASYRPNGTPFADVSADAWYYVYVALAKEQGLVQGSGGTFRPEDPLTREELAVLIVRAMGLETEAQQKAKELEADGRAPSFADGRTIAPWASAYAETARIRGLMNGVEADRFDPQATATRSQGAVLILRAMERSGMIGE
ncbi:S-layer homology domain-containing protein [Paenibacillus flagellatus]|nr:S-layer homology domain-containing protein [Paenibacillus flagellatus]